MVPDQNGTVVDFSSGDTQVIILNYSVDAAWDLNNVEFIAFVEDMNAKEALQTVKRAANDLHPEFTTSDTAVLVNQSLTFTNLTTGGYIDAPESYEWLFPGATPSTSVERDPSVIYTTAGNFDVTLIVNRGSQIDTITKEAYITASFPSGFEEKSNFINAQIFPNPNNGEFTLELNPVKSVVADLFITNANGAVVYKENGLNINGKMVKSLNLGTLSPGVYYLSIQNADSKTVQKLIVK
jgi:PKD repeat protein